MLLGLVHSTLGGRAQRGRFTVIFGQDGAGVGPKGPGNYGATVAQIVGMWDALPHEIRHIWCVPQSMFGVVKQLFVAGELH